MAAPDTAEQGLGLRERKNRRTRLAIVRATAELTIEGGWASATIPRIAERADVAPRTVSTWFPAKEDILFEDVEEHLDRAEGHLRAAEGDVVDRLRAWIDDEAGRAPRDLEIAEHRRRAIDHDPTLRARGRQHYERIQAEFARAASERLGAAPTDVRPQIFAGAAMAFLWTMETAAREDADGTLALLEEGFAALRATFDALAAGVDPA